MTTVKVGLIGAPKSGKTELAQQLAQALSPRSVQIVDGYVEELEERSGLVFGHYATYLGNIECACARHEAEFVARQQEPDLVITCGTLINSIVYTGVHAFIEAQQGKADRRGNLTMLWLGTMLWDLWDYDLAYYLPVDADEESDIGVVDKHIPECIESLGFEERIKTLQDPEASAGTVLADIDAREKSKANQPLT